MKDLRNKVVVITGAGSGIGRSLTLKMHNKGARLALNDFNKQSLDETLSCEDAAGLAAAAKPLRVDAGEA